MSGRFDPVQSPVTAGAAFTASEMRLQCESSVVGSIAGSCLGNATLAQCNNKTICSKNTTIYYDLVKNNFSITLLISIKKKVKQQYNS